MSNKLLTALQLAVTALESGSVKYDWRSHDSCNCGILAQSMLNINGGELCDAIMRQRARACEIGDRYGSWSDIVKDHCSITGESNIAIINQLRGAGLSHHQICEVEMLSNKEILREAGIWVHIFNKDSYFRKKENVIRYFKAWIKILGFNETSRLNKINQLHAQIELAARTEHYELAAALKKELENV